MFIAFSDVSGDGDTPRIQVYKKINKKSASVTSNFQLSLTPNAQSGLSVCLSTTSD